jgi:CDP-diacylglycerol--glycerol-3-phosphate 3-phosphatidyltransferase
MNLPNIFSLSRIFLSPLFFVFFFLDDWTGTDRPVYTAITWILFVLIELSDLLDGFLARKLKKTSDLGKILDPFADSLSRLTYFICFTGKGIMPLWVFLLIVYRDLGVAFVRQIAGGRGIAMGARLSGKIKAWVYAIAGVAGMIRSSVDYFLLSQGILNFLNIMVTIVFILCAAIAVYSLSDYLKSVFTNQTNDTDRR